jgi:hypothetical protein
VVLGRDEKPLLEEREVAEVGLPEVVEEVADEGDDADDDVEDDVDDLSVSAAREQMGEMGS